MGRRVPSRARGAYAAICQTASRVIDRGLDIQTAGNLGIGELGIEGPHRMPYEAGNWFDLRRVLRPAEVSRDDVFLDLGCGKGRMVLMARRYPFRQVIGVELSPALLAIARRNVRTCRLPFRCHDVELVHTDVMEYEIPNAVTVVYMFNPFSGPILDAVIARLIASVDRRPRTVRIVCRNHEHEERLLQSNRLVPNRISPGLRPGRRWRQDTAIRLYTLTAAANQSAAAADRRLVSGPPP